MLYAFPAADRHTCYHRCEWVSRCRGSKALTWATLGCKLAKRRQTRLLRQLANMLQCTGKTLRYTSRTNAPLYICQSAGACRAAPQLKHCQSAICRPVLLQGRLSRVTSDARLAEKSHHVPQHSRCHQLQQGAPAGSPAQGRSSTLTSVTHAAEKGSSTHLAMSATMPGWKVSRTSRPCQPLCRPPRWRDCRDAQGMICTRECTDCNAKLVATMSVKCKRKRAARMSDYCSSLQSGYMHQAHLYAGLVGLHSRHVKTVRIFDHALGSARDDTGNIVQGTGPCNCGTCRLEMSGCRSRGAKYA